MSLQTLYLFSTSRAIKFFYQNHQNFLPNAQSIGEFLDFVLRVENKVKIPEFLRLIYLYEAIRENQTKGLGEFAKNFSQFLLNSSFFLKFYDELCAECIVLEQLEKLDVYAFYDDHLKVLKAIFKSYKDKLAFNGFFDKYFLEDFKITFELLGNYDCIEVALDGFLSRFEMLVFEEISLYKPVFFKLDIQAFNQKYYENLFGLSLKFGEVVVKLEAKKIEKVSLRKDNGDKQAEIHILQTPDRITQIGAMFMQIDKWLQRGIAPEEICVVLPNEDFVKYLKLFDRARNFNFAMGKKIIETSLFKSLLESLEGFRDLESLKAFLAEFKGNSQEDKKIKTRIYEVLEKFECGLKYLYHLSPKDKVFAFLFMLEQETLDDVGGGRISIMGILETRGIAFSYVLIPEFIEENVPALSHKDIFLNTTIRQKVGLPTRVDRENLQKYYYSQLFKNSKEVWLLTLDNQEDKPSRFLLDERVFSQKQVLEGNVLEFGQYFLRGGALNYREIEIIEPLELKFSPTSLECFLTCKRKYYYRYVQGFKEKKETFNIGSKIHKALQEGFSEFLEKRDFQQVIQKTYQNLEISSSQQEYFLSQLAKRYLEAFLKKEEKRLQEGWIPLALEKEFSMEFCGIPFYGKIDRIDKRGDEILILDYKYKREIKCDTQKNYEKSKDFQLPIYALALKDLKLGESIKAAFYSICQPQIIYEEVLVEKQEYLSKYLEEIKAKAKAISFELSEKREVCRNCEFIYLCNRY
ncbi:PD-(D/E)XK nuclease family protein [Helicobacter mesocricetorum]|uniref:PD-(D/E)XK nuclease family protein n=1 Tax=Helicobacter mesocricetorum TaxID=87012 RepID=UPI000CF149C9|nr:PD-(D/E)XK nuclease family protein [Helicobacter mesocricetorum]